MSQQLVVRYLSNDQDVNPGRSYSESAPALTQSWSLKHPVGPGTVGQSRRISADGVTLEWFTPAVNIAGSAIDGFVVYAGPGTPGYPANPQFIALTPNYIPGLPASQITSGVFDISLFPIGTNSNSVAIGNDSRFHNQNTDLGTNSATFKIGSGLPDELVFRATATGLEVISTATSDYANLRVANIIAGNEVNIGDNNIVLNGDMSPAVLPTENAGISVNRGTETSSVLEWNEATDEWQAGIVGDMVAITRRKTFAVTQAQANTVGGFAIVHNLGTYVAATFWVNGSKFHPVNETPSLGSLLVDFGGLQFSGVITVRIDG
jgi:hypothetical protein